MIIQAFLRWTQTAKASDRARAARALARAYGATDAQTIDRRAAGMAMTVLLDDPSPKVRLALAEVLATQADAPRPIILSLAEDQPEIAFAVVTRSTVLTDDDLVDLAARGTAELRAFIAARRPLSRSVAAALCEIGDVADILLLLENEGATLARRTLRRLCDRFGDVACIRNALLERSDLPADARQVLVEQVSAALNGAGFLQAAIGGERLRRVVRQACETAAVELAGDAADADIWALVEALRATQRLTPALLINALCHGRIDFFAAAIVDLTGVGERRVRSILSNGRIHAVQALLQSSGLSPDVGALLSDAIMIWRRERRVGLPAASIASVLIRRLRQTQDSTGLSECVERLAVAEERRSARDYIALATPRAA